MPSPRKSPLRRIVLGTLGAAAVLGPAVFSGCAVNFAPPSQLDTLRVISVSVDKPYIAPHSAQECADDPESCTVHFNAEIYDGYGAKNLGGERTLNVLWIGGCFDPEGDQYSLCLIPLLALFQQASPALKEAKDSHSIPKFPKGLPLGWGPQFSMSVPDIVSQRPKPSFGPHYGVGYVFFLACAGHFGLLDTDPSAAGNFPIGCFDDDTEEQLGAESFVPGYTQIYSFEDGRLNPNPPLNAVMFDGEPMSDSLPDIPVVPPCDVPESERNLPPSCSRQDPYEACKAHDVDVDVPDTVADDDPGAQGENGEPLKETVWVNYYADAGNFKGEIKLLNDPTTGLVKKHTTTWIAPPVPGLATLWTVVRDARGGSTTFVRQVRVE